MDNENVSPTVTVLKLMGIVDEAGLSSADFERENLRSKLNRSGVETEEGIVGLILSNLLEGEFIFSVVLWVVYFTRLALFFFTRASPLPAPTTKY